MNGYSRGAIIIGLFALAVSLTAGFMGCAGGLFGSKESKLKYFQNLEEQTLDRLVKENPKAEEELAKSVGYAVVEKKIVKIPIFGAGSGAGVVVEKAGGKRTYLRVPELQFGAGWGGRVVRVVMIFRDPDKLRDLAGGEWHAGVTAEAAAKAGEVGASGGAGSDDAAKKGYATYVLTDAGVSATVTISVLRVQPYSID